MDILEKIDKEIKEQTRNGRTDIYVSTEDLKELGYKHIQEGERQFINIAILENLIQRYKFKTNLKVEPYMVQDMKKKINQGIDPDEILQRKNDEVWEK